MTEQFSLLDFSLSIGLGLVCGCVATCVLKLRASSTTLFVLTMLAVCSTWIGINTDILRITDACRIHCNFFLQALFFAAALHLAVRQARKLHSTTNAIHSQHEIRG
jgi:hypothetical protein